MLLVLLVLDMGLLGRLKLSVRPIRGCAGSSDGDSFSVACGGGTSSASPASASARLIGSGAVEKDAARSPNRGPSRKALALSAAAESIV